MFDGGFGGRGAPPSQPQPQKHRVASPPPGPPVLRWSGADVGARVSVHSYRYNRAYEAEVCV